MIDQLVRERCKEILRFWMRGLYSQPEAYARADQLTFFIWNHHPHGVAAHEAIAEVSFTCDVLQGFAFVEV